MTIKPVTDHSYLIRALVWVVLALVLGVLAIAADGQEAAGSTGSSARRLNPIPPESPTSTPRPRPRSRLDRTAWAELSAQAALRALDLVSTRRAQRCACNREDYLPQWVVESAPRLAGFEAGAWMVEYWGVRRLSWNHRKLARVARVVMAADVAATGWAVGRNFGLAVPVAGERRLKLGR